MLAAIKASLMDAIKMSDEVSDAGMDKAAIRWQKIETFLKSNDYIMNADVRQLCGASTATANRILKELVTDKKLTQCRVSGHWAYRKI